MTTLTPDQGLVLPTSTDGDNVPQSLDDYNDGVESRLVKRYSSSADRTTRNPTPNEGELSYLTSTGLYDTYDGSAWAELLDARPRGVMGTPTTSTLNGTATAADTTEVRDAVLGNYVFTAVADRWYEVVYIGALANSGTASVRFQTNVRDGGASTPTTSSTLVDVDVVWVGEVGTGGRTMIRIIGRPQTFTAGTHTLSAFTISPDSAVLTPASSGTRVLYVRDIGAV